MSKVILVGVGFALLPFLKGKPKPRVSAARVFPRLYLPRVVHLVICFCRDWLGNYLVFTLRHSFEKHSNFL